MKICECLKCVPLDGAPVACTKLADYADLVRELDLEAMSAYLILESAIARKEPDRAPLVRAFTEADTTAQNARKAAGHTRLNYLEALASRDCK